MVSRIETAAGDSAIPKFLRFLYISWDFLSRLQFKIPIHVKVEKTLKGSLDSIPSPSVKIQIMGGRVCLRCKGKTLLGVVNKLLLPQVNFPTNNLNFH